MVLNRHKRALYYDCTNYYFEIEEADDVATIISINQKRWQIEECFRIMKSEFQARPVYLSRKDRITTHFVLEWITRLYLKEK